MVLLFFSPISLRHSGFGLWHKKKSGALLWFFFGLVGGLISVGIFYLIRINYKLETQHANQPDRE